LSTLAEKGAWDKKRTEVGLKVGLKVGSSPSYPTRLSPVFMRIERAQVSEWDINKK